MGGSRARHFFFYFERFPYISFSILSHSNAAIVEAEAVLVSIVDQLGDPDCGLVLGLPLPLGALQARHAQQQLLQLVIQVPQVAISEPQTAISDKYVFAEKL